MAGRSVLAVLREAEQDLAVVNADVRGAEAQFDAAEDRYDQAEQKLAKSRRTEPSNSEELRRLERRLHNVGSDVAVLRKAFHSTSASFASKEAVVRLLKAQLSAAASASFAERGRFIREIVSCSVGRVLTWSGSAAAAASSSSTQAGTWDVAGQCVCVVHPRILLTAAHICWEPGAKLRIRVLFTASGAQPWACDAHVIRCSGRLNICILLLDVLASESPFKPADVAALSDYRGLFAPGARVALWCFPIYWDLQVLRSKEQMVTTTASAIAQQPTLLTGAVANDQSLTLLPHKDSIRSFTILSCDYASFAGCSGGGVFAGNLSASGAPLLLSLHRIRIESDVQDDYSGDEKVPGTPGDSAAVADEAADEVADKPVLASVPETAEAADEAVGEPKTPQTGKRCSKRKTPSLPLTSPTTAAAGGGDASTNTTPQDSREQGRSVKLKLQEEANHMSAMPVSIVVESVLRHSNWGPDALMAMAEEAPRSKAGAYCTVDFPIRIIQAGGEETAATASTLLCWEAGA